MSIALPLCVSHYHELHEPVRGDPRYALLRVWIRFAHADLETSSLSIPDIPHMSPLGVESCRNDRMGRTAQIIINQGNVASLDFTSAVSK